MSWCSECHTVLSQHVPCSNGTCRVIGLISKSMASPVTGHSKVTDGHGDRRRGQLLGTLTSSLDLRISRSRIFKVNRKGRDDELIRKEWRQNYKRYQQEPAKKTETQQAGEIRRGGKTGDVSDCRAFVIKSCTKPSKWAHGCRLYILEFLREMR